MAANPFETYYALHCSVITIGPAGATLISNKPTMRRLFLVGCAGFFTAGCFEPQIRYMGPPAFIAPLDGQTGYPTGLPITVTSDRIDLPDDYLTPDLIRVSDLDTGAEIVGNLTFSDDGVQFVPNQDWRTNRRYIWTIDPPIPVPHGPELDFPDHLIGTAIFDTSKRLKLLNAGVDAEGNTCMVFSRTITSDDSGTLRVTVNDIEVEDAIYSILEPASVGNQYTLQPDDEGVSVVCFQTALPIDSGASLRLWWGNEGPWRVDLIDATPDELVRILRRGNY